MSTRLVSVVVDAVDPPALARWWSVALGWPISFEEDDVLSCREIPGLALPAV